MTHPTHFRAQLRLVLVALACAAAAVLWVLAFQYLLVIFAGLLFAVFLHAISAGIARHSPIPYRVALALLLLFGLGASVGAIVSFAPTVAAQVHDLRREVPEAWSKLHERFPFLPTLSNSAALSNKQSDAAGTALKPIAAAIGGSLEIIGGLVVVFFLGIYGAAQPKVYREAVLALTPARFESHMERALCAMSNNLARWLIGRCVAMLFVGVASTIGFHFLGIPIALALGVFAGALTFIEYAGAVISAIPPILLALAQSPTSALGVAILFTGLHIIEGYVLTPLLARAAAHVPPAITLSAQVILGSLAGALGMTFSTPLLVAAIAAVNAWREQSGREDSEPARQSANSALSESVSSA